MSDKAKITITSPSLNLKETMKNVDEIAPDPSFSYVEILQENDFLGGLIEEILEEENPNYVYNGTDDVFLQKLEEVIESNGVYMMLGLGVDSDRFVYDTGFGAKITKNDNDEYEITFGVTGIFGHGMGGFTAFDDNGDAESEWDIASDECKEALRIANNTLVLE